ncbi:MAG: hypothetical protein AB1486_07270 [Planctomycetota bacterium]
MTQRTLESFMRFLQRLEKHKIHYDLRRFREDAVMVLVRVPGEFWEIDFMLDGSVEVEVLRSDGTIHGEDALEGLFSMHGD